MDAVAPVDVLLTLIIYPCHPELDHTLRLYQPRLFIWKDNACKILSTTDGQQDTGETRPLVLYKRDPDVTYDIALMVLHDRGLV